MKYREYIEKYKGEKVRFEMDSYGYFRPDFTGRSYANGRLTDIQEDFVIIYDQLDKSYTTVPYTLLMLKYSEEPEK